jgi:hypothetical protein
METEGMPGGEHGSVMPAYPVIPAASELALGHAASEMGTMRS